MDEEKIYVKAIQSYMLAENINQDELASRLHVSPAAVGKWLLGHNGITRRNKEKIRQLCGKWLSDPADVIPEATDSQKDQLRTMVASLGRAAVASDFGNPVVAAIEEFRNLIVMAMYDIEMPAETRSRVIRAISNVEFRRQGGK